MMSVMLTPAKLAVFIIHAIKRHLKKIQWVILMSEDQKEEKIELFDTFSSAEKNIILALDTIYKKLENIENLMAQNKVIDLSEQK